MITVAWLLILAILAWVLWQGLGELEEWLEPDLDPGEAIHFFPEEVGSDFVAGMFARSGGEIDLATSAAGDRQPRRASVESDDRVVSTESPGQSAILKADHGNELAARSEYRQVHDVRALR
jgi:hypothetical protein